MTKAIFFCLCFLSFQLTHAGPFVGGGDPPIRPIVAGLIDSFGVQDDLENAKVIIQLVDASRADAPSEVLLRVTYEKVKEFPLYYTLSGIQNFRSNAYYLVQVLVDMDGDERISKGDYINSQAVPVNPFHPDEFTSISLMKVN